MLELEFSIYQQSQEYMYKCINVCDSNLMQELSNLEMSLK